MNLIVRELALAEVDINGAAGCAVHGDTEWRGRSSVSYLLSLVFCALINSLSFSFSSSSSSSSWICLSTRDLNFELTITGDCENVASEV